MYVNGTENSFGNCKHSEEKDYDRNVLIDSVWMYDSIHRNILFLVWQEMLKCHTGFFFSKCCTYVWRREFKIIKGLKCDPVTDFGVDHLEDIAEQTKFPWLLSNITDKLNNEPLANGKIKELIDWHGVKVWINLSYHELWNWTGKIPPSRDGGDLHNGEK